jgi:hypothetical protein
MNETTSEFHANGQTQSAYRLASCLWLPEIRICLIHWGSSVIRLVTPASTLMATLAAVRDCFRTRAALQSACVRRRPRDAAIQVGRFHGGSYPITVAKSPSILEPLITPVSNRDGAVRGLLPIFLLSFRRTLRFRLFYVSFPRRATGNWLIRGRVPLFSPFPVLCISLGGVIFVHSRLTAAIVVLIGVEQGILIAMIVSLLRIVHHSYHPHSAVLVTDAKREWSILPVVPGTVTEPGLVIYRFGAPLFYANSNRFSEEIRSLVDQAPAPVRWLVVDAGSITRINYTAARSVERLKDFLTSRGVLLGFAHVGPYLRADLDRHHLSEAIGPANLFDTLHEALTVTQRVHL